MLELIQVIRKNELRVLIFHFQRNQIEMRSKQLVKSGSSDLDKNRPVETETFHRPLGAVIGKKRIHKLGCKKLIGVEF